MEDEFQFPENYEDISNNMLMRLENEYNMFNNINPISIGNKLNEKEEEIEKKNKEQKEEENEEKDNENLKEYQVFEDEEEEECIKYNNKNNDVYNKNYFQKKEENENQKIIEKNNIEINSNKKPFILKNPDKLKKMLSKINFPTPKWAKNISDKDFINEVNKILNKK